MRIFSQNRTNDRQRRQIFQMESRRKICACKATIIRTVAMNILVGTVCASRKVIATHLEAGATVSLRRIQVAAMRMPTQLAISPKRIVSVGASVHQTLNVSQFICQRLINDLLTADD